MIQISNLTKGFGDRQILKGVSLNIEEGSVVSIIGGSGSGKSTFSKCLIRLWEPDGGKIVVDELDITHIADEFKLAAVRRNFGYLFQEGALFDSSSVAENVTFGLKYLTDIPASEYRRIATEKLALVGLQNVEDMRPSELSGGMRKRVALARAIAAEPKYIIYDEPTSGLDPIMSDIINDLVLDMKSKIGVTSIVITHDMKSAYKISDTIVMLYEGQFIMAGSPDEFRKTANPYVRQFVDGSSRGPIKMKLRDF
ncbi:MAG: ABC transporter ATP-binding protein [Elusimicrobiaceae bacterium]|jgi:phospholipid/cholesterol/gamma-HCH transport system ATP-binding protein